MNFSEVKAVRIPEGNVKRILSGEILLWSGMYVNQVSISIDLDGSIYNGCGYVNGMRLRSTGALAANVNSSVTGFIPVTPGDTIRMSGWDFSLNSNGNCIGVFDETFNILGSFTMIPAQYGVFKENADCKAYGFQSVTMENGIYTWVVPPLAAICYIRVNGYDNALTYPGPTMIVTVNQEISI